MECGQARLLQMKEQTHVFYSIQRLSFLLSLDSSKHMETS